MRIQLLGRLRERKKMSLSAKYIITVLILVILVFLTGYTNYQNINLVADDYQVFANDTMPRMAVLGELLVVTHAMQDEAASYALLRTQFGDTPSPELLQLTEEERQEFEALAAQFWLLMDQYEWLVSPAGTQDAVFCDALKALGGTIIDNGRALMLTADADPADIIASKNALEAIELEFDELIQPRMAAEFVQVDAMRANAEQQVQTSLQSNIYLALISLTIALLLGGIMARQVIHPLNKLRQAAAAIQAGHLSTQVEIENDDELGDFAHTFNHMANAIAERDQRLQTLNQELEARVESRTRELMLANQELEAANRVQSEFLQLVSHELRTPLHHIMGFTSIIRSGMMGTTSPQIDKGMAVIDRNSEHLLSLIDDILTVVAIEAGQYLPKPQMVAVETLINDWRQSFARLAHSKGLDFEITAADTLPAHVLVDPNGLKQMVQQLVSNACKFTQSGSITIHLAGSLLQLDVSVIDTGVGIPEEHTQRIFEPFRQLDGSSTRQVGGLGTGLTLVQRLSKLMDGSVSVKSTPGEGSIFRISVPIGQN